MVPRVVETGVHMASIEKPSGGYRVKYRRPLGRHKSKRFVTKDDARRFNHESASFGEQRSHSRR